MYTKYQVWPVLNYDEITKWVDRKTEKSIVTPRCMYMSVKYIGKRCYIQSKSSKPVKWTILNSCINYHIKRWFSQCQMSSSLFYSPRSTRSKRNTQRAAHATRTRNTQHAHATRNTHTQHATRKNHPKSPFQGLEPLSQVLKKLDRNKKLNPSLANRVMGRCQTLKK